MGRKKVLVILCIFTILFVLAGCLDDGTTDKNLVVVNEGSQSHNISVIATGDFSNRTYSSTLSPNESVVVDDFLPQLDYNHEASMSVLVDGVNRTSKKVNVNLSMKNVTVLVNNGTVRLSAEYED